MIWRPKHYTAFSLVEVTLAIGIAGFGMIAIFGLLPIAAKTNLDATSQTAAIDVFSAVAADIRATPKTSTTSPQYGIVFGANTTLYFDLSGKPSASLQPTSRYHLTVSFPTGPTGVACAILKVGWPAAASSVNASGSVEGFAAVNRN
jgi:uncharacterized protein (TIGR02598 family)